MQKYTFMQKIESDFAYFSRSDYLCASKIDAKPKIFLKAPQK